MIKVNNLSKIYSNKGNDFQALNNVSFDIAKGRSVAIIGKSGSGKSTLMHLLAGLDTPTSGEIDINEQPIYKFSKKEIANFRNKKLGFVFQQFFLQPNQTVLENVVLPLKINGIPKSKRDKIGLEALKEVNLEDKAKNLAINLSGGQKQRVCIARAIVNNPEMIFADEPTGNLDSENGEKIIKLLFDLNKNKGITLVVVTHDEDLANMCDDQIHIKDGKLVEFKQKK